MNELKLFGWLVIFFSIMLAFLLTLLPLPSWATAYRPDWVIMVVLYWTIALPNRINLITAWLVGLLLDVLLGTLLGENALALVIIAYIAIKMHRRIRMFPLVGQAGMILILLLLDHLLLFWLQGMQGHTITAQWFWFSAIVSACLWPWVFVILTDLIRRYRLH